MKYTEIFKIIKETFKEGKDLKLEKKNGRIILSMSKDNIQPPKWFSEWAKEDSRWKDNTDRRLDRIEKDVESIKNCPTIKKELADQNK